MDKPVDDEELTRRLQESLSECPACGSDDMERTETDGESLQSQTWVCNDCNYRWAEFYRFERGMSLPPE